MKITQKQKTVRQLDDALTQLRLETGWYKARWILALGIGFGIGFIVCLLLIEFAHV